MSSQCFNSHKSIHFSEEDLAFAWSRPIPSHVAIIMDGNRRWEEREFYKNINRPFCGHWAGANALTSIVEAASDLGIKVLTVYAFSTENWERSPAEVETLLEIFQTYLESQMSRMVEQGVRFHAIGNLTPFSAKLKHTIENTTYCTQSGDGLDFVVALNYGGRDDMKRAIQKIADDLLSGRLSKEEITEELISKYVDTAPFGDPDFLIRTSGERRFSNFLLWQTAYTEIYLTETLWPDFTPKEFFKAILDFQMRKRRIGK